MVYYCYTNIMLDFCSRLAICRLWCLALNREQLRRGPCNSQVRVRHGQVHWVGSCHSRYNLIQLVWKMYLGIGSSLLHFELYHYIMHYHIVTARIAESLLTGLALCWPSPPHSDLCAPATEDHNWQPLTHVERCRTTLNLQHNVLTNGSRAKT